MGVGGLFLSYAVMWTHSRETKPERKSEMKREGDHVLTYVLLLLEKSAERKWFVFLDRLLFPPPNRRNLYQKKGAAVMVQT